MKFPSCSASFTRRNKKQPPKQNTQNKHKTESHEQVVPNISVVEININKWLTTVLVAFSHYDKHPEHKQPGDGTLYYILQIRVLHCGKLRQELKQRPWRSTKYQLAPLGLFNLLCSTTQYLPREIPAPHVLGPSISTINTETVLHPCLQNDLLKVHTFVVLSFHLTQACIKL